MIKRKIFFFVYCSVAILVPRNPNLYTLSVGSLLLIANYFCHYFFRMFLEAGPPATKTVLHELLKGLTILYQLLLSFFFLWNLMGFFFGAFIIQLANSYPNLVCMLASPRWIFLPLFLYFLYLAFFKLMIAVKPEVFNCLDHDKLFFWLKSSAVILLFVEITFRLGLDRSTCQAKVASLIIKDFAGVKLKEGLLEDSVIGQVYPTVCVNFILMCCTVVQYAVAELIMRWSGSKFAINIRNRSYKGSSSVAPLSNEPPALKTTENQIFTIHSSQGYSYNNYQLQDSKLTEVLCDDKLSVSAVDQLSQLSAANQLHNVKYIKEADNDSNITCPIEILVRPSSHMNEKGKDSGIEQDLLGTKANQLRMKSAASPPLFSQISFQQQVNNNLSLGSNKLSRFSKVLGLLKGVGFLAGFVFLLVVGAFLFMDKMDNIAVFFVITGMKAVLQCLPMYWLVLEDSIYQLAKRRTLAFMSRYVNFD